MPISRSECGPCMFRACEPPRATAFTFFTLDNAEATSSRRRAFSAGIIMPREHNGESEIAKALTVRADRAKTPNRNKKRANAHDPGTARPRQIPCDDRGHPGGLGQDLHRGAGIQPRAVE